MDMTFAYILCFGVIILPLVVWLFLFGGTDRIKNPEEYSTPGKSGERIVYNTLVHKYYVPEEFILKNLYVPTNTGDMTEIDLAIITAKGVLVFECRNYAGKIYGNAKNEYWTQYLGGKRFNIYNPLLQNRSHAKYLKQFLMKKRIDVPVIPIVVTVTRGEWKVSNLGPKDYFLGVNYKFDEVYASLSESLFATKNKQYILDKLKPLTNVSDSVKQKHIEYVNRIKKY